MFSFSYKIINMRLLNLSQTITSSLSLEKHEIRFKRFILNNNKIWRRRSNLDYKLSFLIFDWLFRISTKEEKDLKND